MGGGGGGGGSQQTSEFKAPLWTLNQWPDFVQAETSLAEDPQEKYYGQRIAGINNTQAQGMQYLANLSGNSSPDMAAMRRNLQITASGGFENPYSTLQTLVGTNPYAEGGADAEVGMNPYLGKRTDVFTNDYEGMGDRYKAMKQSAMDDVVNNYQTAIAPGTEAAFNRAGAFNGGGHDAAIAANQNALARNLSRMSSEMDTGQWDRSGDLQQQRIGLNVGAQQGDFARDVTGTNQWLDMANDSSQADLSRQGQLYQQGINLGVQAQMNDNSQAANYWAQERGNQMNAFNPILQANQFEQNNARNMTGIGDIQRGYTQDLLNSQYGDWQNTVNFPGQALDRFGNALSRASGNYGTTTQMYGGQNYQANPFAQALGVGMLGMGAYNAMGS